MIVAERVVPFVDLTSADLIVDQRDRRPAGTASSTP
jgi:hypothetical protein